MDITKKLHYATSFRKLPEVTSLRKWKTARKSSFSNSECSERICSWLIPEESISKITSTGQRMPLIQGFPWQIEESIVTLLSNSSGFIRESLIFFSFCQIHFIAKKKRILGGNAGISLFPTNLTTRNPT